MRVACSHLSVISAAGCVRQLNAPLRLDCELNHPGAFAYKSSLSYRCMKMRIVPMMSMKSILMNSIFERLLLRVHQSFSVPGAVLHYQCIYLSSQQNQRARGRSRFKNLIYQTRVTYIIVEVRISRTDEHCLRLCARYVPKPAWDCARLRFVSNTRGLER